MKVFISWSGSLSKNVAELLKPWIKCVLQATEPFMSTEDIDKGALWFHKISDQLADTGVGIICLTPDNYNAPWILFEAGGLAKGLRKSRLCTLLINLSATELKPPLSQFNATTLDQPEMFKMISSINEALGEKPLPKEILADAFNQSWGNFKSKLDAALVAHKSVQPPHQRSDSEKLDEVLELARSIHSNMQIFHDPAAGRREPSVWDHLQTPVTAELTDAVLGEIRARSARSRLAAQVLGPKKEDACAASRPGEQSGFG